MDLLVDAFDHLALNIFIRLNDKSLANCRRVNKAWKNLIDGQKFYYIRQIVKCKRRHGSFFGPNEHWRKILENLDSKQKLSDLKNMTIFFKEFFKLKNPILYDPLEWMVSRNQLPWVKFLLKFVTDVDTYTNIGTELEFETNEKVDDDPRTPLITACRNGNTDVVKLLFEQKGKKINFNVRDFNGSFTPFVTACSRGEVEIVKLFLKYADEYQIDLNNKDDQLQWGAFIHAITSKQDEVVDLLLQDERIDVHSAHPNHTKTPFLWACEQGYTGIMKAFLKHAKARNINVNAQDAYGQTGFMLSCIGGIDSAVQMLLDQSKALGIDVNKTDNKGRTALTWACMKGE